MANKNSKKRILIVTAFPTHGAGSGALITTQAKSYIEAGYEVTIITANNRTDFDKIEGVNYHLVPFTAEAPDAEEIEGQCPFNYPMFTTHTESTANFWNLSLEQLEEYMSSFENAINEEVEKFKPDIIHTQHNWLSSSIATKTEKPIALTIHGTDLMGYKKANEKLDEVLAKLEEVKQNADQKTLNNLQVIEEIYKKYTSKKQILIDLKKAMDAKKLTITKPELEVLVELFDKKTIYELYKYHAENSAKKSEQIIVISEDQRNEFNKLFAGNEEKVVLLENGYDPKTFYVDETVKKEDALPEDKQNYDNLVLFVGKFADFKGIDALLDAAKIYEADAKQKGKVTQTIIVGSGVLDEKLRAQAEELGLEHTHFVGRKNHTEIRKLQNLADVSLIPSRNEPFGLVVIEGTSCGHPVIATNAGGIPGILNTEKEDLSDTTKSYETKLGVLVPPLPERPQELSDEEKDQLDSLTTKYFMADDEEKININKQTAKTMQLKETEVANYNNQFALTVNGISDAVIKIIDGEISFDNQEIADYTRKNYGQDVIREKLINIFDTAIEKNKSKQTEQR
ncbi:MAG: glycosyltransferase [Clostridia bacterium]|nr:glycosyltransferase [Clostridia bacterium]